MGYAFLYLASLIAGILLAAAGITYFSRYKKRWLAITGSILWLITLLAPPFFASVIGYGFHDNKVKPDWLFAYTLSWTIIFVIAGLLIVIKGLKRTDEIPNASRWPMRKMIGGAVAAGAVWIMTLFIMDSGVKKELDAFRKEAMDARQSMVYEPLKDMDNAAELYRQAGKPFANATLPDWLYKTDDADFDPSRPEVREYLKANAESLSMLNQACAKKGYYVEIDIEKEDMMPLPQGLVSATRLMAVDARLSANTGNAKRAMDDIVCLNNIARHMRQAPTLLTALMADSIEGRALKAFQHVLPGLGNAKLPHGYASFNKIEEKRKAHENGLRMEAAYMNVMMQKIALSGKLSGEQAAGLLTRPLALFYRVFTCRYDISYMRSMSQKIPSLTSRPYYESRSEIASFKTAFESGDKGGLLAFLITPTIYFSSHERFAKTEALDHAAAIGVAAFAYHEDKKRFPDSIEQLAPKYLDKVPLDPFDGNRMRLKKTDKGIAAYSIGVNGQDEGGGGDDIAFVLSLR